MEPTLFISNVKPDEPLNWTLPTRLGEMLLEVEDRYGPRDQTWTPLGIDFGPGSPMVWHSGASNSRHIVIRLASNALDNTVIACYQLAHECVHLLSPSLDFPAPVLEEGLATVFSEDYVQRKFDRHGLTPSESRYATCAALVRQLLALEPDAIKKLRSVEPAFFKMTARTFEHAGVVLPSELTEALLGSFAEVAGG